MGAGKTTLVQGLARRGLTVVPEPARIVIAEQRATGGRGTSDQDPRLFIDLMLELACRTFDEQRGHEPVIFDRGLPDLIVHSEISGIDPAPAIEACRARRYADTVFLAAGWPEIYTTDEERTMTYEQAAAFGERVREVYEQFGYTIAELPRAPVEDREAFVMDAVSRAAAARSP